MVDIKTRTVDLVISRCAPGIILTPFTGLMGVKIVGRPFRRLEVLAGLGGSDRSDLLGLRLVRLGFQRSDRIKDTMTLGRPRT